MPTISMFYGILIKMNYREHNPPHIHVEYNEYRAVYGIDSCELMNGELPQAQSRLVLAWMEIHRDELLANWKLSELKEELYKIDPLK